MTEAQLSPVSKPRPTRQEEGRWRGRSTMRAARFIAPRRAEIIEIPLPHPNPSQVRVRVQGCGLCGSNLPVWQGRPPADYPLEPGAPGHEGWGWVDEVGADVNQFTPGDRVAFLSYRAFAEFDLASADHLLRLPQAQEIFPGEPLACAVNVLARAGIRGGETVAVIGVGFLGALLVQLAIQGGANVIAVSRRESALAMARRFGAIASFAPGEPVIRRVMAATGGDGCDCVIEAVGEQAPLDLAAELVRIRGRLVIAGYHQESRLVNMQLWNWRGLDVINAHERDPLRSMEGMRLALSQVADNQLELTGLITHDFPLEEISAAFVALEERPPGFMKAWIRP